MRPWGLQLCSEPQEPVLLEGLDPPEVERVPHHEPNRIAAPAAEANAPDDGVQEAAQPPDAVAVVPARFAADPLDRRPASPRPLRALLFPWRRAQYGVGAGGSPRRRPGGPGLRRVRAWKLRAPGAPSAVGGP